MGRYGSTRMCVIKTDTGSIGCLPVINSKQYYMSKYHVICFVNKMWNPHYILRVKRYFDMKKDVSVEVEK